jgi:hypothetical protein
MAVKTRPSGNANSATAIKKANHDFMQQSIEKLAYCPVTGGSGQFATFTQNQTLFFDLPTLGSAYIKAFLITYSIVFTPANSGTASYAINAAFPWNILSQIKLDYGNTQINAHPYFLKCLDILHGYTRGPQQTVLCGNNDQTIATQLASQPPALTPGTQYTITGKFLLRLNAIGEDTVPGILPANTVGNTPQLKLTCATLMGNDPLTNPIAGTNGNGTAAITVSNTSQISVEAVYLDGSSMKTNIPYLMNLDVEPTLQYYWEPPLTPFNAGTTWQRKQISTLLEHWYMISIIIDGQQSNTFLSSWNNLTAFAIGPDAGGQNFFRGYNAGNNIPIWDYFDREWRLPHGQDLDLGVLAWVDAPSKGVTNPENRHGSQVLNMDPSNGGFVSTNHYYQVGAVSTANNIVPRVETFLVSMNKQGLKIV